MVQEVLSVPEVTCEHCVNAIEGAVGALAGVDSVKVDLDRKDVTISYDDAQVGHESIVTAIKDEGYEVAGVAAG
ncbi:MAG TPA: copper ion binding protein [Actinomycetota bacterium]|nr:copper ion binding protein [Actinomycetota bacterium]